MNEVADGRPVMMPDTGYDYVSHRKRLIWLVVWMYHYSNWCVVGDRRTSQSFSLRRRRKSVIVFANYYVFKVKFLQQHIPKMPEYKLSYFATTGVAELIRFLFSYADQDFEDIRHDSASWPTIKPSTPYGVMPVLEIDGKKYHQSLAIARYLAKEYNLSGNNRLEDLEIDALVETINDYRQVFTDCLWESDAEKKSEKKESLLKERMPFYLNKFEEQVSNNGGYFYGGRVTWVDLFFTSLKPYLDLTLECDTLKDHKILKELTEKIEAIPNIKKWIENRPTRCCIREMLRAKTESS